MSDCVRQGTVIFVPTAFLLSVLVLGQTISRYASAYVSAPSEVLVFIDALDSSVEENESYDRDLARVPRLEDKLRLDRLLRQIKKAGDDLREELNSVLVPAAASRPGFIEITGGLKGCAGGGGNMALGLTTARLRMPARILWAARRTRLNDRLHRMDMLRMRFLVVYMSIVATPATTAPEKVEKSAFPSTPERTIPPAPPLPSYQHPQPHYPALGLSMGEKRRPPMRRLTTQAMGHHDSTLEDDKFGSGGAHRRGWAGVVQELQRSPLMHKRHASIENQMRRAQTP